MNLTSLRWWGNSRTTERDTSVSIIMLSSDPPDILIN